MKAESDLEKNLEEHAARISHAWVTQEASSLYARRAMAKGLQRNHPLGQLGQIIVSSHSTA